MRVQIPAYTDHWMKGDRYGDVVDTHMSRYPIRPIDGGEAVITDVVRVKLDKSGKVRPFLLCDCEVVE
jgi:hypothetical protein